MPEKKKIYECGPLRYTLGGLILVCGLLMLGFFSVNFASNSVGLVSLRLKFLGASDMTIAFIISTIGGIFNMTVCPTVSFKSDRYRGKRWGRRIVFIISTLPMMCISMIGFAASGKLGGIISSWLQPLGEYSPATVTIGIIAVIMVVYKFFYMFVGSVIHYIYNDIIPPQFLARVVGMVQVASTASSTIFNFFCFKYAQTHFEILLLIAAAVYMLGVGTMCLLIKEPQLPPLSETEKKQSRGFMGIFTFMKESFSHRFYWYNTFATSFLAVGLGINIFQVFFYMSMGLDLDSIGKLNGTSGMVGLILGIIMATGGAILVDRWHPVRVQFYATLLQWIFALVFGKWVFCTPGVTVFFIIVLASSIIHIMTNNICGISGMPKLMRTLPKSRFGQFCSANAMVRSLVVLVFGLLLGGAIDLVRRMTGCGDFVYRLIWIWQLIFGGLGLFFCILTYREYLKLGGECNFKAPAPWSPEKWEALPNTPSTGITAKALKVSLYIWDGLIIFYGIATIFFIWYSKVQKFIFYGIPVLIICAAVWLAIRSTIRRRMPADDKKVFGGVLHPGILWMAALQQFMLGAIGVTQTVLLLRESSPDAAFMWAVELGILLVMLVMLWICSGIEKYGSSEEISIDQEAAPTCNG